jgi:hypothetical protein
MVDERKRRRERKGAKKKEIKRRRDVSDSEYTPYLFR